MRKREVTEVLTAEYIPSKSFLALRRNQINNVLRQIRTQFNDNNLLAKSTGIDLGSWYGISTKLLSEEQNNVTAVEYSNSIADIGVELGNYNDSKLFKMDAAKFIKQQALEYKKVDFITLFGAVSSFNLNEILYYSDMMLKSNGILLITAHEGVRNLIDDIVKIGGEKFIPKTEYFWDEIGFVYIKDKHPKLNFPFSN